MEKLDTEILEEFKKSKDAWRPGMGVFLGDLVVRIHSLEAKLETTRGRLKDAEYLQVKFEGSIRMLENKIAVLETRLYRPHRKKTVGDPVINCDTKSVDS